MTDLERRALLGDAEAQRECTEKGIVLRCPCCGEKKVDTLETKYYGLVQCMECGLSMAAAYLTWALARWNTRPAPPIGRCVDCAYWDKNTGECANAADTEVAYHKYTDPDFFCGDFKPKGGEENAH